jgi:hypothetical protein
MLEEQYLDQCYPGMSELEAMVTEDMYQDGTVYQDWYTLSNKDKEVISQGFWLQYLDDISGD